MTLDGEGVRAASYDLEDRPRRAMLRRCCVYLQDSAVKACAGEKGNGREGKKRWGWESREGEESHSVNTISVRGTKILNPGQTSSFAVGPEVKQGGTSLASGDLSKGGPQGWP